MTRKIVTVIAALTLALALCLPAAAAELPYAIGEVSDYYGAGGYSVDGGRLVPGFLEDFEALSNTRPGTELFLPLRAKDFQWDREEGVARPTELTPTLANQLRLSLEYEYDGSADAFDAIALEAREGQVGILVRFKAAHHSIEPLAFRAEVRLMQGASAVHGSDFVIEGTLANRTRFVYTTTTGVQLGLGRMATGYYDVTGLRFDLGEGVTLTGDILLGQTLYGAAESFVPDARLLADYPQLRRGLRLHTVNMSGRVRIDTGDEGVLHVYDGALTYLGTTAGPLRQERVYYLSASRLS